MANIDLKEKANAAKLSKILGLKIQDLDLFAEALTHRSFVNEDSGGQARNNERLEFIGDAVLELAITEFLFNKYAQNPEGELTSFRAALVRTESLAAEAKRLKIGEFIQMSYGEETTGGRDREYILANTMEALIGAIYLQSGYKAAAEFILKNISYKIERIVKERSDIDAKSKLQEVSQEKHKITPMYVLKSESGPDHNKQFEMAVVIGEHEFATGKGKSKQEAEQQAASSALQNWSELEQKYFN
jgi:ribonuclease-3